MVENSYFDFAENDFLFFQQTYQAGIRGNALAALGQSICERYLKHIADRYANPEDEMESFKKQSVLRTHSLHKLVRFLKEDMGLSVPEQTENDLKQIDGFYFTTRYPGDDSFVASAEDIEKTWETVQAAREFVVGQIQELENCQHQYYDPDEPEL